MNAVRLSGFALFAAAALILRSTTLEAAPQSDGLTQWLSRLERSVPREAAMFSAATPAGVDKAADAVEQWMAHWASFKQARTNAEVHDVIRRLLAAKSRVDRLLDEAIEVRRQFAVLPAGPEQDEAVRGYLRTTSRLIDLSGRSRYLHVDALSFAVRKLMARPADLGRLLDLLIAEQSSAGATVLVQHVLSPPGAPPRAMPPVAVVKKLLELIRVTGERSLLPAVVALLELRSASSAEVAVEAAETIRAIGLPQDPRPQSDEPLPPPAVTAARLDEILSRIDPKRLTGDLAGRHAELRAWLAVRRKIGLVEEGCRLGTFEVQPGDWLLMRNPSPYNQFTSLSPGLFTHVGVVALERAADGISRMVVVDLPERGSRVPATNVEVYVERTLHYCFLRHPEAEVARAMAA
ncbi:MAG TPA: hypothetical protein VGX76_02200, partial [Pirellulales bacterium]|nr:hypothetical protein [Pirellulales bacterium]